MRRNLAKQNMPGWIDGSSAESSVNLITLGVSEVIRPKVTVQADRVAAAHIVQHPHGELESAGQLAASNECDKILARRQSGGLGPQIQLIAGSPSEPRILTDSAPGPYARRCKRPHRGVLSS